MKFIFHRWHQEKQSEPHLACSVAKNLILLSHIFSSELIKYRLDPKMNLCYHSMPKICMFGITWKWINTCRIFIFEWSTRHGNSKWYRSHFAFHARQLHPAWHILKMWKSNERTCLKCVYITTCTLIGTKTAELFPCAGDRQVCMFALNTQTCKFIFILNGTLTKPLTSM